MSATLLLDRAGWDLTVDISGNIAVASEPYSLAQDAASYIRLFQGELWYDTTLGIPYWTQILGKLPPLALMRAKFVAAALAVPGVATAKFFLQSFVGRAVAGQVQITSESGEGAAVNVTRPISPQNPYPSMDFSKPSNSQYLGM